MPWTPSMVTSSDGVKPKRSAWRMPVSKASVNMRVHMSFSSWEAIASALFVLKVPVCMVLIARAGSPWFMMWVSWMV